MTMLGMQTEMQCHYFPSYFSTRDPDLNGSFIGWPSSTSAVMNGHYYNENLATPFADPYMACRDKFKHIMLQHEAIFKSQVHELHRLYNKQRELMVEMKRIEFSGQHLHLQNSMSNRIFPEASFEHKQKASVASAIPWLNTSRDQPLIPLPEIKQSHTDYVQRNMMLCNSKECELLESNCKRIGDKILDLELPAYEYIDSDTEESLAKEMNPSEAPSYPVKSSVENLKCFADLNEPIKLEEEMDNDIQCQLEAQAIESTEKTDMNKIENQQECQSDIVEDDEENEQGSEVSPSFPLDLNNGNLLSKRKYHCDPSSRKHKLKLERIPMIVQALPCNKSFVLLKGSSRRRSYRHARDDSYCHIDIDQSVSEDGSNGAHVKGIDLNAISHCYSPEEQLNMIDSESVRRPEKKSSGTKFLVDLNSCINEDESLELHPPESPEQSRRRRDSDKNQLDIPREVSIREDLVTMAAEAIVSISSSEVQKGDSSLYWFAKLASCVVDDPNSEYGMVLSCKKQDDDEGIDYFEAMTLQLKETVVEEYCFQATNIQIESSSPDSLPRRGRRQQKKDFQSEILPSLTSLSWYEVNEDLQAIGGLIDRRRTGRNGWTRGRRGRPSLSSKAETPLCLQLNQLSEKRNLLDWGKITRRRRGQRYPANNPRLIVGQV